MHQNPGRADPSRIFGTKRRVYTPHVIYEYLTASKDPTTRDRVPVGLLVMHTTGATERGRVGGNSSRGLLFHTECQAR